MEGVNVFVKVKLVFATYFLACFLSGKCAAPFLVTKPPAPHNKNTTVKADLAVTGTYHFYL